MNKLFSLLSVCGLVVALSGCNASASDNDSSLVTQTQLNALQTQVAALQAAFCSDDARVAGLRISSVTSSSGTNSLCASAAKAARTQAVTPVCTTPPTIISRGQGATATTETLVSCAGYVWTEDLATGTVQKPDFTVFYDGADCTGNPYATQGPVPLPTLTHGLGLQINQQTFMVTAGEAVVSTVFLSTLTSDGNCTNTNIPFDFAYPIVANDPNVSAIPNTAAGPQIPGA